MQLLPQPVTFHLGIDYRGQCDRGDRFSHRCFWECNSALV
jgi:hypothetical protein